MGQVNTDIFNLNNKGTKRLELFKPKITAVDFSLTLVS